jgi:hypothetical protein
MARRTPYVIDGVLHIPGLRGDSEIGVAGRCEWRGPGSVDLEEGKSQSYRPPGSVSAQISQIPDDTGGE